MEHQLTAYGVADAHLTSDPEFTHFKAEHLRHSNFALEPVELLFSGRGSWGQRVELVVPRKADMLGRTYIVFKIPDVGPLPVGSLFQWRDFLGHVLVRKVSVSIGSKIIDSHNGEWLHLVSRLRTRPGALGALRDMVCMYRDIEESEMPASEGMVVKGKTLYVPLEFFFCRGQVLPLVALQYHEVRLTLDIGSFDDCAVWVTGKRPIVPDLEVSVIAELAFLDVDERRRVAQESHELIIETLQTLENVTVSKLQRMDMPLNHPCKELIWLTQADDSVRGGTYFDYTGRRDSSVLSWSQLQVQDALYYARDSGHASVDISLFYASKNRTEWSRSIGGVETSCATLSLSTGVLITLVRRSSGGGGGGGSGSGNADTLTLDGVEVVPGGNPELDIAAFAFDAYNGALLWSKGLTGGAYPWRPALSCASTTSARPGTGGGVLFATTVDVPGPIDGGFLPGATLSLEYADVSDGRTVTATSLDGAAGDVFTSLYRDRGFVSYTAFNNAGTVSSNASPDDNVIPAPDTSGSAEVTPTNLGVVAFSVALPSGTPVTASRIYAAGDREVTCHGLVHDRWDAGMVIIAAAGGLDPVFGDGGSIEVAVTLESYPALEPCGNETRSKIDAYGAGMCGIVAKVSSQGHSKWVTRHTSGAKLEGRASAYSLPAVDGGGIVIDIYHESSFVEFASTVWSAEAEVIRRIRVPGGPGPASSVVRLSPDAGAPLWMVTMRTADTAASCYVVGIVPGIGGTKSSLTAIVRATSRTRISVFHHPNTFGAVSEVESQVDSTCFAVHLTADGRLIGCYALPEPYDPSGEDFWPPTYAAAAAAVTYPEEYDSVILPPVDSDVTNPTTAARLLFNGIERFGRTEGSFFAKVQRYQAHASTTTSPGINVYSFALQPDRPEPTGTCNMSRMENVQLELELRDDVLRNGSAVTRVYVPTYNVLRIMSGMAGLAYAA